MTPSARQPHRRQAPLTPLHIHATMGFTLIEVLIALAIIAIACTAASRSLQHSTDTRWSLQQHTLALWRAQNQIAQLHISSSWPDIGQTQYNCPSGDIPFACKQRVMTTANPRFRRVDIEVVLPTDPQHVITSLSTLLFHEETS